MAEGIQITLGEVSGVANTIRSLNSNMMTCLDEIHSQMKASADYYDSTDGEEIRANFDATSAHFEEYRLVIESYAKFLDDTVAALNGAQNSNTSNADMFKG